MNRNQWFRVYVVLSSIIWLPVTYVLVGFVIAISPEQSYTIGSIAGNSYHKKVFVVIPLLLFARSLSHLLSVSFLNSCIQDAHKAFQQETNFNARKKRLIRQTLITGTIAVPIAIIAALMLSP